MKIAAVILAGGRSSRMGGGDKGLLDLAGKAVIAHVIERLTPQCADIAINANGAQDRFSQFGLPVIADLLEGFAGPLAGVQAGLRWAVGQKATHLVTVAADTPFFPANLVERIGLAPGNAIAVAASKGRWHPTFALWPVATLSTLSEYLEADGRRVVSFIEQQPHRTVGFAPTRLPGGEADPFFNINTPDDLAEALRLVTPRAR